MMCYFVFFENIPMQMYLNGACIATLDYDIFIYVLLNPEVDFKAALVDYVQTCKINIQTLFLTLSKSCA